jgi:hypothetical protein
MKWKSLVAAAAMTMTMALAVGAALATAAPRKAPVAEKSPDVLQPQQLGKAAARSVVSPLLAPGAITAAAAPTVEEVGDADSFGRNVTYLGLAQTQAVVILPDCTGSDPAFERCIVGNPAPSPTTFNESDLASISLPAKATKSLVCFTLTPVVQLNWRNTLATPALASFAANAVITFENPVLDDPALIDPGTGLPFGGSITLGLSTFGDTHTLQSGEVDSKLLFMSRGCIAGVMNKRSLVENYGLTDIQAKEFFKKPMNVRFGSRGNVALSEFTSYFYGIRLYGD